MEPTMAPATIIRAHLSSSGINVRRYMKELLQQITVACARIYGYGNGMWIAVMSGCACYWGKGGIIRIEAASMCTLAHLCPPSISPHHTRMENSYHTCAYTSMHAMYLCCTAPC
jgi:hypothetical protein